MSWETNHCNDQRNSFVVCVSAFSDSSVQNWWALTLFNVRVRVFASMPVRFKPHMLIRNRKWNGATYWGTRNKCVVLFKNYKNQRSVLINWEDLLGNIDMNGNSAISSCDTAEGSTIPGDDVNSRVSVDPTESGATTYVDLLAYKIIGIGSLVEPFGSCTNVASGEIQGCFGIDWLVCISEMSIEMFCNVDDLIDGVADSIRYELKWTQFVLAPPDKFGSGWLRQMVVPESFFISSAWRLPKQTMLQRSDWVYRDLVSRWLGFL